MAYLLDTHLLLWFLYKPAKLPLSAGSLLRPVSTSLYFSAVSFAEIAIKQGTGKLEFAVDLREMRESLLRLQVSELQMDVHHTFPLATLRNVHKDPFDRMLVAQAEAEGLILLTVDQALAAYGSMVQVLK